MPDLAEPIIYKFDDFLLDKQAGTLSRLNPEKQKSAIQIGSRAFQILCLLVDRPGEVVSRQTIMDVVWPNIAVEENNLTVQLSTLRRVLDADRGQDSCIQTIPGRGYRFRSIVVRSTGETESGNTIKSDDTLARVLDRAKSSLDELCQLLEAKAERINECLGEQFSYAPVADFLIKFNELHQKHLSALRAGMLILAHDVLGEIHRLSSELCRREYDLKLKDGINQRPVDVEDYFSYAVRHVSFDNGPLIHMYVESRLVQKEFKMRRRVELPNPTPELIIKEYVSFTAILLNDNLADAPALAAALGDPDKYMRHRAAAVLARNGPAAIPAFAAALGDPAQDVRQGAAMALAKIGPAAAEAVPALMAAFSDPAQGVRQSAAMALATIGPTKAEAVPAVVAALGDPAQDIRRNAAAVLARIGPASVPALVAALGDPAQDIRRDAAAVLARIGPASVPALVAALGDPAHTREGVGEASVGERIGQPLSRESKKVLGADVVQITEGNMVGGVIASARPTRRGRRPWHVWKLFVREREISGLANGVMPAGPHREDEES